MSDHHFTLTLNEEAVIILWQATDGWRAVLQWWEGTQRTFGPTPAAVTVVGQAVCAWWQELPDGQDYAWSPDGAPIFLPSSIPPEYIATSPTSLN